MEQITYIAKWRKDLEEITAEMLAIQEELENSELGKRYEAAFDARKILSTELAELESNYKDDCVAEYAKTQDKDQPGGKVKIFTELVFDMDEARGHVVEKKMDNLLKLDLAKFKKYAKAVEPDFVTFKETPKMTLNKDLSEFLK